MSCCLEDGTGMRKALGKRSPVSVSVHNARSPFLGVVHHLDSSLQGLPGFVDDAVSNLEEDG